MKEGSPIDRNIDKVAAALSRALQSLLPSTALHVAGDVMLSCCRHLPFWFIPGCLSKPFEKQSKQKPFKSFPTSEPGAHFNVPNNTG